MHSLLLLLRSLFVIILVSGLLWRLLELFMFHVGCADRCMLSESSVLAIAEFAGCIPAARLASASKAFSVAKRIGNKAAYTTELETILNSRPLPGS